MAPLDVRWVFGVELSESWLGRYETGTSSLRAPHSERACPGYVLIMDETAPGCVEERVRVPGAALWTASEGAGPPLVLCHGGPGLSDNLAPVAAMVASRLCRAHTRCLEDQHVERRNDRR